MSQIHILDGQTDDILDYIQADNIIDDTHKKSLEDTLETFEFIAFADKSYAQHLEKRNRIIIPDEDGTYREFVIFEVAKYRDTEGLKVQVFSHGSYLELKKTNVIYPNEFKGTISQHAGRALNKTGWQVGVVEGEGNKTISINAHTSPYENLRRIAKDFEVELRFRVETDGRKITGRYVDFLERIGEWRGREVEFGKDLVGIRRVEKQDIVTALLGLGPEREDGSRIEVLVEDFDALQRWGWYDEHGNLNHYIEPYEIQSERSEMTEAEARRYTRTALNKRINTQVTYECEIADLEQIAGLEHEKIRFGDTIKIKDTEFNPPLYVEARVFEQERSIVTNEKKSIKLGDFIEYTEEEVHSIWEQLKKQIQNRVSYYEMIEYTYDKLTIDTKDETVFEEGKSFAEATGIQAREDAKAFAVEEDKKIKLDVEQYADNVAEQKANSALEQAKMYAVAKTVYENQMEQIASDIADRAPIEYVDGELRHAIDSLEIGGRNLFREGLLVNLIPATAGRFVTYSTGRGFYIPVTSGEVYSLSRSAATNDRFRYCFSVEEPASDVEWLDMNTHDSKLKVENIVVPEGVNYLFVYIQYQTGDIPKIKLEKGNKATDWSPAPEDIFSEIEKKADGSTVYTIEQIDNKINNLVSVTQYTTDMDGIVTQLESHGTRIGQNEQAIGLKADRTELDQVENSLSTKIANVEVKADQVTTRVESVEAEIDGLEIGGRNLNRNSNNFSESVWTSYDGGSIRVTENVSVDEWGATDATQVRISEGNRTSILKGYKAITGDTDTVEGETYTVSLYVKNLREYQMSVNINGLDPRPTVYLEPYEAKRIVVTGKRSSYGLQLQFRSHHTNYYTEFIVWRAQVEKGNKATDWTPAPEDTEQDISNLRGRVNTAEGEIRTLAGEVSLKASQTEVDSLERRVSTAEGELQVLPGQINAKVSKDGVIGAINATPERLLIDFDKVKMTGELEAKHIKSLAGLNINDQFVVDSTGKVTIGNDRVTIDDKSISITRPDGAIWMQDGMVKQDFNVTSVDPYDMDYANLLGNLIDGVFRPARGFYRAGWEAIVGGGDYRDIRDPDKGWSVKFTSYEFIHSARYLVIGYRKAINSTNPRHNTQVWDGNNRLYLEYHDAGGRPNQAPIIIDLGTPTYEVRNFQLRIGVNKGDVSGNNVVAFRIDRVFLTDDISVVG